jgi:hypothetical protein
VEGVHSEHHVRSQRRAQQGDVLRSEAWPSPLTPIKDPSQGRDIVTSVLVTQIESPVPLFSKFDLFS